MSECMSGGCEEMAIATFKGSEGSDLYVKLCGEHSVEIVDSIGKAARKVEESEEEGR